VKKFLSLILAGFLLTNLLGCSKDEPAAAAPVEPEYTGFAVPNPIEYPLYTFEYKPNTEDLRAMAIQAMRDLLSIQWHTDIEIAYRKTGPVSAKHFMHHPETIYCGTIYSNASTGIFQFLEFYNYEHGLFSYPRTVEEMKEAVGNSCADSLLWAWSTVCPSIAGGFYPSTMVYSNGYRPVGDYEYDHRILSYQQYPTNLIIEKNGTEKIIDCYLQVKPADALVSSTDDHAMMAIEEPHLAYDADGNLDLAKSYIAIQDQRGGSGAGFYEREANGNTLHYSGRIYYQFTFQELLEKNYIPVTTDEFLGVKSYETPVLDMSNSDCKTLEDLLGATISSNYPLAVVRATHIDGNTKTAVGWKLFSGAGMEGVPKTFTFRDMPSLKYYTQTGKGTLRIDVIIATGEEFTVAEVAG